MFSSVIVPCVGRRRERDACRVVLAVRLDIQFPSVRDGQLVWKHGRIEYVIERLRLASRGCAKHGQQVRIGRRCALLSRSRGKAARRCVLAAGTPFARRARARGRVRAAGRGRHRAASRGAGAPRAVPGGGRGGPPMVSACRASSRPSSAPSSDAGCSRGASRAYAAKAARSSGWCLSATGPTERARRADLAASGRPCPASGAAEDLPRDEDRRSHRTSRPTGTLPVGGDDHVGCSRIVGRQLLLESIRADRRKPADRSSVSPSSVHGHAVAARASVCARHATARGCQPRAERRGIRAEGPDNRNTSTAVRQARRQPRPANAPAGKDPRSLLWLRNSSCVKRHRF